MKIGSMVKIAENVSWMNLYTDYGVGIVVDIEPDFYKKGNNKFDRVRVYWAGKNRVDFEPILFLKEIE